MQDCPIQIGQCLFAAGIGNTRIFEAAHELRPQGLGTAKLGPTFRTPRNVGCSYHAERLIKRSGRVSEERGIVQMMLNGQFTFSSSFRMRR